MQYNIVDPAKLDAYYADLWANWEVVKPRMRHATAEERGEPVSGRGRRHHYHSRKDHAGRSNGVSSGSRILPHRYRDEGDKGKHHRREIRRRETLVWHAEVWEALEQYAAGDF